MMAIDQDTWDLPKGSDPLGDTVETAQTAGSAKAINALIESMQKDPASRLPIETLKLAVATLNTDFTIDTEDGRLQNTAKELRRYIPLPGGWEYQTKGGGSTIRLLHVGSGERRAVCNGDMADTQAFVAQMAEEANAATVALLHILNYALTRLCYEA